MNQNARDPRDTPAAEVVQVSVDRPAIEHPLDPAGGRTLLGHPPGLFLLFAVEMWERFSYYGMRGLLVLYLIAVFAASQLSPGIYTNTLSVSQTTQNSGIASVATL